MHTVMAALQNWLRSHNLPLDNVRLVVEFPTVVARAFAAEHLAIEWANWVAPGKNRDGTTLRGEQVQAGRLMANEYALTVRTDANLVALTNDQVPLVLIESPLRGDSASATVENQEYARRAMRDSLARGECPFASHLLYAQPGILDDDVPAEREQGIAAGLAWGRRAARTVVYYDRGVSHGMRHGIAAAREAGREVVWRTLDHTPLLAAEVETGDSVQLETA